MAQDHMTADSSADIEKLTDMIHKLLNAVWGVDWGLFTDEEPTGNNPESTTLPHITYDLVRRVHTKDRTIKQQQFDSFPDPENEGHNIILYRTWFDCLVEFDLYAATRKEATRLAQKFEVFMETYKGYFKEQGVAEIIFQEEESPKVSSESRQDIPHRTVRYLVRIERITPVRSAHIKEVHAIVRPDLQKQPSQPRHEKESNTSVSLGDPGFLDLYNQHFPK